MRKPIIKWSKYEQARTMSKKNYNELMKSFKSNHYACEEWRSVECSVPGDCKLKQTHRTRYARDASYDASISNERRFGCDNDSEAKVATIILDSTKKNILLVSSYGYNLGIPKGSLHLDETPHEGVLRELKEETGSNLFKSLPLIPIIPRDLVSRPDLPDFVAINTQYGKDVFLFCTTAEDDKIPNIAELVDIDFEISSIEWTPIDTLPHIKLNSFTSNIVKLLQSGTLINIDGSFNGFH